jgi:hypothetical protein
MWSTRVDYDARKNTATVVSGINDDNCSFMIHIDVDAHEFKKLWEKMVTELYPLHVSE